MQRRKQTGRLYENKTMNSVEPRTRRNMTSKFDSLMMFGYDSAKAEYYSDYIQMESLLGENPFSAYSSMTYNAEARIARTGYRTEFEAFLLIHSIRLAYPHSR